MSENRSNQNNLGLLVFKKHSNYRYMMVFRSFMGRSKRAWFGTAVP
jgi:hypothetical protein